MNGWIKIHRQLLSWEWYSCTNTTRVFIHLLLTASWRNARWQGVEIPRGSVFASPETLATATGLSRQQVRTVITRLKSTSEITTKSTSKGTLITLCNFETYNSEETDSNQHFNQRDNQKLTSDQPAINQRLTTSEEGKKDKKDKKERTKAAKASSFDFSFPPEMPEQMKDALIRWQAHRREIKKPITATGWAALIADCLKCPATMEDAISKSILSGWQGLFPDPSKSTEPESAKSKPKTLPPNWRKIGQLRYGRDFSGVEIEQLTYDEFGDIQRDCRFYADNPEQLAADMAQADQLSPP
jgi:hypothetical protein